MTRFTGIYVCRKSKDLVGPVRSGRYYSIDLWQDLHVLPFFFGAESEGIGRYHRAHMPYVNGIRGPWPYFYRSPQRVAPHNLYANLQLVRNDFGHNPKLDRLRNKVGHLHPNLRFRRRCGAAGWPADRPRPALDQQLLDLRLAMGRPDACLAPQRRGRRAHRRRARIAC